MHVCRADKVQNKGSQWKHMAKKTNKKLIGNKGYAFTMVLTLALSHTELEIHIYVHLQIQVKMRNYIHTFYVFFTTLQTICCVQV